MSEEDRSWQIEQFETFSCQRDFSHNWDDKDHDRWRGEAWPSIDHTRELTDGLLLTNSYAPLRQNIKRQKSIWLSRWLVDTRVRQMCVWSITRNPPSIPLKVILTNNLNPHHHHHQAQHYHHHHHLHRHHHRVLYMWPSLFTLWHTSLHPQGIKKILPSSRINDLAISMIVFVPCKTSLPQVLSGSC